MSVLQSIIVANLLISAISLIGILTLAFSFLKKKNTSTMLVSFAAGILLATAFLNILPEALEGLDSFSVMTWTMIGMIAAFLMERTLLWYHHHHDDSHDIQPTSLLVIIGDAIHNFIDGLAIAAAFIVSPALGMTTVIAIAAHEIPQEIADYTILRHCGLSRTKAILFNFVSAFTAVLGGLIGFYIFQESIGLVYVALALAAGIFIYVSAADLIPELHKTEVKSGWIKQTLLFLIGIILMYAITVNTSHTHEHEEPGHDGLLIKDEVITR